MSIKYFWEDVLSEVPICKSLVSNYPQIKQEILEFVKNPNALHDYPKYSVGTGSLYENYWKAVPLSSFDGEFISLYSNEQEKQLINYVISEAKRNCPTIHNLISNLEQEKILSNCFISRLIPGSIINPHQGWTQDYMRIHMGIVCDPECRLTVGDQTKTWEEGKLLAFRDGDRHSVKHEGTQERIVLSVDVRISYLRQFVENIR